MRSLAAKQRFRQGCYPLTRTSFGCPTSPASGRGSLFAYTLSVSPIDVCQRKLFAISSCV
jgi:hypothetical protein